MNREKESDFRADLHCHSNCSDGSEDPRVLLRLAVQADLQGLSITDHDTMDAYTPELFADAESLGIRLLPGIELSAEQDQVPVHVLGYGYDLKSFSLKNFLIEMNQRRAERNRAILRKLEQKKMPMTEAELLEFAALARQKRTIGRPHIAQLMVKKKYVSSPSEAFDKYLKEGASCYAAGIKYTPAEAIAQIHQAQGKAILAHPHFLKGGSFLKKLLSLPFDGLECYYARLSKVQETPWLKIAKERNWIATGGSDYHGELKPHIPLGSSWVGEHTFRMLLN
ncbi:MAG: PHP domain-containing protein [Chlamydiota bacterium]